MRGLSANSLACHCEEQSDEAISRPRLPRSLRSLAMTRAALAMTTRQWMGWRKAEGGIQEGFRAARMRSATSRTAPSPPFFLQTKWTALRTDGMASAGAAEK